MMISLGYDLVVEDDDFTSVGATLVQMADQFEQRVETYLACLQTVSEAAVRQGVVAENLAVFYQRVSQLKGEAGKLAVQIQACLAQYVSDIDRADKDLY
jgi:hypothetical protein